MLAFVQANAALVCKGVLAEKAKQWLIGSRWVHPPKTGPLHPSSTAPTALDLHPRVSSPTEPQNSIQHLLPACSGVSAPIQHNGHRRVSANLHVALSRSTLPPIRQCLDCSQIKSLLSSCFCLRKGSDGVGGHPGGP